MWLGALGMLLQSMAMQSAGLVSGVDMASAVAAIETGSGAIGVTGTAMDAVYPQENAHLFGEVSDQGLLMSQVPLCLYAHQRSDARKSYFLDRSELLATISEAVSISGSEHRLSRRFRSGAHAVSVAPVPRLPYRLQATAFRQ